MKTLLERVLLVCLVASWLPLAAEQNPYNFKLRQLRDRFPAMGPALNRASGAGKTMLTVAEYREREARLAITGEPTAAEGTR